MSGTRQTTCYQWLDHTADLRLRVTAADVQGLFACVLEALVQAMVAEAEDLGPQVERRFVDQVADEAEALVVFANELIFSILVRGFVPVGLVGIVLEPPRFDAVVAWRQPGSIELRREIKAATYSGLSVEHKDGMVVSSLVFDV